MTDWRAASDGRGFESDGSEAFLVADTAWSAFADATVEEWRQYTRHRAAQGFTHLLISVLPILHDRSVRPGAREPFAMRDGRYDYDAPDERYFSTARELVAIAHESGLHCALVLLWCCYVPDTWGAERTPWAPMSPTQRDGYLRQAIPRFADLDPMFIVSGDDAFDAPGPAAVYLEALHLVGRLAPGVLTTMHSTPSAVLPPEIADDPDLGFYAYQAGHGRDQQDRTWLLAEQYLASAVRRPVVDLEPCYEGHGYGGEAGGRWQRRDVRAASWWSILGGAAAGIGYGAHGVWQWHRAGARFTSPDFSQEPYPWEVALRFPAADDVGFAARLVADTGLIGAEPAQGVLVEPAGGVRAAVGRTGTLAVYLPEAGEVAMRADVHADRAVLWDLGARRPLRPRFGVDGELTVLRQPDLVGDSLLIVRSS